MDVDFLDFLVFAFQCIKFEALLQVYKLSCGTTSDVLYRLYNKCRRTFTLLEVTCFRGMNRLVTSRLSRALCATRRTKSDLPVRKDVTPENAVFDKVTHTGQVCVFLL